MIGSRGDAWVGRWEGGVEVGGRPHAWVSAFAGMRVGEGADGRRGRPLPLWIPVFTGMTVGVGEGI